MIHKNDNPEAAHPPRPMRIGIGVIHCKCNDAACKQSIWFDSASRALWHSNKLGEESLMYLDANSCVELIKELREVMMQMTVPRL